jgi:phosphohistidine phosphatase
MKSLLLLRHAESSDKQPGQSDHERGLTPNGIRQSIAVASFMKEKELKPEQIIASDAARVRMTVEAIVGALQLTSQITYSTKLYDTDVQGYLEAVRRAPNCQNLLIGGHNPVITAFASFLSKTKIGGMGTANLLLFQFKDDDWSKLNKGQCELMEHFVP